MERLIQFIMENIVFIVIIVGVISSLLSKVKGVAQPGQESPSNPPGRGGMPPFGQGGSGHDRRRQDAERSLRPTSNVPSSTASPVHRPSKQQEASGSAKQRYEQVETRPKSNREQTSMQRSIAHEFGSASSQQRKASSAAKRGTPAVTKQAIGDHTSPIYQALTEGDRREQAMKGMAWSEVFGPPRSMKRHAHRR